MVQLPFRPKQITQTVCLRGQRQRLKTSHHCFNSQQTAHLWVVSKCYITHIHTQQRLWKSQQSKTVIMGHDHSFVKSIKTLKLIWSKALRQPWLCWHQSWYRLNGWCSNNANGSSGSIFRAGLIFIEATVAPVVTPCSALNRLFHLPAGLELKTIRKRTNVTGGPSLPCPNR